MSSYKVRIAGTHQTATFTPRGKGAGFHQNGFIRRIGITVSGYAYRSLSNEWVFYSRGKNAQVAYANAA